MTWVLDHGIARWHGPFVEPPERELAPLAGRACPDCGAPIYRTASRCGECAARHRQHRCPDCGDRTTRRDKRCRPCGTAYRDRERKS